MPKGGVTRPGGRSRHGTRLMLNRTRENYVVTNFRANEPATRPDSPSVPWLSEVEFARMQAEHERANVRAFVARYLPPPRFLGQTRSASG